MFVKVPTGLVFFLSKYPCKYPPFLQNKKEQNPLWKWDCSFLMNQAVCSLDLSYALGIGNDLDFSYSSAVDFKFMA